MPIRSANTYLQQLYLIRDKLLRNEIQSYSIGERNFTLFNLTELEKIIRDVECAVVAEENGNIYADLSKPSDGSSGYIPPEGTPMVWQ